jgi:hypothetical protein
MRSHLRPVLAVMLVLGACTSQPSHLDAPGNLQPPANIDPQTPPPPAPAAPGYDGVYRGAGTLTRNPKGVCIGQLEMVDMVVSNNAVQFGRFSGQVRPNGSVLMVSGRVHIQGRFAAGRFRGNMTDPKPGCDYHMDMARIG